VHYVQANLLHLPLKTGAFNLGYSSGVLHHTPDPRAAFAQVVRSVAPGGRIYIWMYGTPRLEDLAAYDENRRQAYRWKPHILKLPFPLQRAAVALIALRVWLRNRVKGPDWSITFSRAMVGAFDSHTPFYRSHHHYAELERWFQEEGLSGLTLTGVREPGFGVYGNRASGFDARSEAAAGRTPRLASDVPSFQRAV
jgi:SAM-dependent methyltransferase